MLLVKKMRPLGRILEVKQHERGTFVRKLTLKTKAAVLKHPTDRIVVLKAPRLDECSLTLLILMSPTISLSSVCFREEKRNQDSKGSVTLRVKSV